MNPEREQVRKVLEYDAALAKRAFKERRTVIYADHSAKGRLHSGATVVRVVSAMEEIGAALVSDDVKHVGAVAKDPSSFHEIGAAFEAFWQFLEAELQSTFEVASGRQPVSEIRDSVSRAGKQRFEEAKSLVRAQLELHRFSFSNPAGRPQEERQGAPVLDRSNNSAKPPKGGRPPAEFWDQMWAAIATALYAGELQPKSQADLQRAMSEWIENNGYSAAESTVKARARRLWDSLRSIDE